MVRFYFHLRLDGRVEKDEQGLNCTDVHEAYLAACRAIPELSASLLARGCDPLRLSLDIATRDGVVVMEVPFAEVLRPRARRRSGLIIPRTRSAMITAGEKYRAVFEEAPFGAVIMTPDLEYVSVNRVATEITSESDETVRGLFLESDEMRSRDPGDTIPRAVASMAVARDSRRGVVAGMMFWGEMQRSAERPPLTLSYWPIVEDDVIVALGVRLDLNPEPAKTGDVIV